MAKAKKKQDEGIESVSIIKMQLGKIQFCILGTTPLIFNSFSEKTKRELMLPAPKLSRTQRQLRLKHNPLEEYRNSVYLNPDLSVPAALMMPGGAFKSAICDSALDAGGKAAQLKRLIRVPADYVYIYGVPKMYIAPVRSADMNRTPDMRTRAILPEWAAYLSMTYSKPIVNEQTILNLAVWGGATRGVGDGRPEKAKLWPPFACLRLWGHTPRV